jgi:Tfp pilus assembly protein PilV
MRRQSGFGYIEALVAVVLLAVAIVPALDALGNAVRNAPAADQDDDLWMAVSSKIRQAGGSRFDDLDAAAAAAGSPTTASSLSDAVGTTPRVLVYLSRYDGDNADGDNNPFTGTDADLIWIRAAIADTPVELVTLVTR